MSKYVKASPGPDYSVIYQDDQGKRFLFSGGTWAWRNHNPGNLRPGQISRKYGQIGISIDQHKRLLAIFPDTEHGLAALQDLLITRKYQEKSIDEAIATYAPPNENNTQHYQEMVRKKLALPGSVKLKNLNSSQFSKLLGIIQEIEGYHLGKIEIIQNVEAISESQSGSIEGYFCPPLGWLSKEKAVNLAMQKKINATVCRPQKGLPYLRSSTREKPFYQLPKRMAS